MMFGFRLFQSVYVFYIFLFLDYNIFFISLQSTFNSFMKTVNEGSQRYCYFVILKVLFFTITMAALFPILELMRI